MKTIRTIELSGSTRQERLPGFAEDFPYIASWAETGQYNGGMVPWHWHPAVELFYMYSGSLVYETPQGTRTFGPGSGGLVNANVLHSTRNLPGDRVVSWIHLFEPSLLGGSVGSRIEQKYLVPITANPALELLALDPADPDQAALLEKLRDSFALDENEFGYELRLRAALGKSGWGCWRCPGPKPAPARRRSMKSAKRCWPLCMNITPSRCVLSRSPRQAFAASGKRSVPSSSACM